MLAKDISLSLCTPVIYNIFSLCVAFSWEEQDSNKTWNALFTVGSPSAGVDSIYSKQSQAGRSSLIWPLFAEICVCLQISFLLPDLGRKHQ